MKPFEINNSDTENLKDAFNRRISRVFVPGEEELEELNRRIAESEIHNGELLMISNIQESEHFREEWECSEIPVRASYIALNLLITELMGESELEESVEGFSLAETMEILRRHAFVQCTELNFSNVIACLHSGGDIIAYFSDELWRSCFEDGEASEKSADKSDKTEMPAPGGINLMGEISGMRVIRITDVSDGVITCDDYMREDGRGTRIDCETFEWLSKNGMMLEVYK